MDIYTQEYKRCDLIQPSGRIDSQTAPHLADAMRVVTDAGHFKIVLDLGNVDFVSSAGLRVFLDVQKTCKRWNRGELVLSSVPPQIYNALDLVGFLPLFKIYGDATEAVGNF